MKLELQIAPTPPEQRVHEIFVWVAINPDGSEGIIATDMVPLFTSRRHVAEGALRKTAEMLRTEGRKIGVEFRIELRHYTLATVGTA